MPSEIASIESPTHQLSQKIEGKHALLSLADRSLLSSDLEVLIEQKEPQTSRGIVAIHKSVGGAAMLAFHFRPTPEELDSIETEGNQ